MTRPTREQTLMLDRLGCASTKMVKALDLLGVLALRLDRIYRRAPRVGEIVSGAQEQLLTAVRELDDAHTLLSQALEAEHEARSEAHIKALEG